MACLYVITQGIQVERVIKRPDYDTTSINNDIALLRLASDVEFNNNVIPACLPTDRTQQYTDYEAVVSGNTSVRQDQQ